MLHSIKPSWFLVNFWLMKTTPIPWVYISQSWYMVHCWLLFHWPKLSYLWQNTTIAVVFHVRIKSEWSNMLWMSSAAHSMLTLKVDCHIELPQHITPYMEQIRGINCLAMWHVVFFFSFFYHRFFHNPRKAWLTSDRVWNDINFSQSNSITHPSRRDNSGNSESHRELSEQFVLRI